MLENLHIIYSGRGKPRPYGVRLATCFLLAGAGYLLFQIAGGFPPWAWRFLFNVLPRLPDLWAAQGSQILLPFIGLLFLSLSLLILWSMIILGISYSLVLLWPASHQQEGMQTDFAASALIVEQQASQPQPRLQPAHARHFAFTEPDSFYEPTQPPTRHGWAQDPSLQEQPSQPMSHLQQFKMPLPQQVQPLRGAVPAYDPLPQSPWARTPHSGTQHGHLRLVPEEIELLPDEIEIEIEPEQDFSEDEEYLLLPTRPLPPDTKSIEADEETLGVSQIPTAAHTAWDDIDDEEEATLRLVIGIGLDPGIVRKDRPNEDSLFAIQGIRTTEDGPVPAGLFVIADGMGGHANGGDASRLAVREISNVIVPTLLRDDSEESSDENDEQEFLLDLLKDGVQRANLAIYQQNLNMPDMMGTTITTALVVNDTAYIINVGDSRTYLYRAAEGLVQITRDHSTVARLVEEGEIEPEEIYTHPQRNQIYRCLGEYSTVEMDTFVVPLEPDDILLLCSDGLWEMVRDAAMEKIITSSSHLPAQVSNILVQAALSEGGADNISVVVVGVVKTV